MMMTAEENQLEKDQLKQALKISVALHLAILFSFTVNTVFFAEEAINFEQAIRVDMVGLPDRIEAPAEKPSEITASPPPALPPVANPAPPTPKVEVKPVTKEKIPDAINLDKAKTKQKQALEKLKQMDALEQIQKELESDSKKKAAATKPQYKGNILAPGTALSGVNQLQADAYLGVVHEHMMSNWYLPEYLKNKDLRTDVVIKFDESGNILSKSIVKPSGNAQFDEYVLAAIQKSSPVPAPPEKFMRISSVQGFLFKFRHD